MAVTWLQNSDSGVCAETCQLMSGLCQPGVARCCWMRKALGLALCDCAGRPTFRQIAPFL